MIEKRFIVARNDWCARRVLKMVYQAKIPQNVLYPTFQTAVRRIQKMRLLDQSRFRIFEVDFDDDKVITS